VRMKRLIERIDSRLESIDSRLESIDSRLESIDEEMRLSRESRERMVEDFRALAHEMETRFERVVRGFERQIAKNNEALDSVLDAVNAQSAAILLRPPPMPDEGV
jgi:chromosome segregation ATPase